MRITPLDIRKQEFHKAMRGLDAEEVYAFLSTVGDEYETLLNDNKALRERVLELDDKVQEYRKMEKTLRDTLITAERVTVEAKDNARREANLIIKEAQIEAEKALRDIKNESMRLHQEVQQLRQQRDGFLARMKVVAESHLKYIETVERDIDDDDRMTRDEAPGAPAGHKPPVKTEEAKPNLFTAQDTVPDEKPVLPANKDKQPDSLDTLPAISANTQLDETPAPTDSRKGELPTTPVDPPPARETDEAADSSGVSTLADINDILERMAVGTLDTNSTPGPQASPVEDRDTTQFEPIPDPPVEEEDRLTGRPKPRESNAVPPEPGPESAIRRAWDYVTADNTGMPSRKDPSDAAGDHRNEPANGETAYDPLSASNKDRDRR